MSWLDRKVLIEGCAELGITLTKDQVESFYKFGELIQETNKHTNLTRVPPEEFVTRHFLDSLLIAPTLKDMKAKSVVDIGTGAGFPGIPLAIALPNVSFLLIDSLLKRIRFLERVVENLELGNVELLHARAEEMGNDQAYRATFDASVSRAVAPLVTLIPWMKPWLRTGGIGIAIKGPAVSEEVQKCKFSVEVKKAPPCSKMNQESFFAIFK